MIKAVIFDCFGVLVTDGWLPFADTYFGHDPKLRQQARDMMAAVNRGMVDYPSFIREVARLAGVDEKLARVAIMRNAPNEPLFDYIASDLKPHYKIGLLSNTGRDRIRQLFTPAQLALFDELALSYETGLLKPEPGAYHVVAERLGVAPAECVFIDDQEKRCAGAHAVGMRAIRYQNFSQLKQKLKELLSRG